MADETTNDVLGEVRQLLGTLRGKRGELVEEREQVEVRITELGERREELTAAIAEVDRMIGPEEQAPQTRSRGVKKAAESAIRDMHLSVRESTSDTGTLWFPQSAIIDYATDADPTIKQHSLVSSLGRLRDEGIVTKRGKRNHYEYALVSEPVPEAGQSTAPESDEKQPGVPSEPVGDPSEIIMGKLRDSGINGCTKKDLAWAVGDAVNVDGVLDRLVLDNDVTMKTVGAEIRYAVAPRIATPQPLFGGNLDDEDSATTPA